MTIQWLLAVVRQRLTAADVGAPQGRLAHRVDLSA
jgi:hypothetical protein